MASLAIPPLNHPQETTTTMQIREHYRYVDQNSHVWIKPTRDSGLAELPWRLRDLHGRIQLFSDDGANEISTLVREYGPFDTIFLGNRALDEIEGATAPAGPVTTVTRKRINPGTYGRLVVGERDNEFLPLPLALTGRHFSADEIRTLIAQLTEIADALEENGQ